MNPQNNKKTVPAQIEGIEGFVFEGKNADLRPFRGPKHGLSN
jgi:hypothetical protein